MAGNKKRIVTFESYMNINSWTVVEMKNNEWEFYLNPYLKSVPMSKKLILKQRGFDDMANDNKKKPLSLKEGTVSNDILYILKEYGSYPENKIADLIPDKKPYTIYRIILRLASEGYILRKKGAEDDYIISLSRLGQDILDVKKYTAATTPRKLTRQGSLSVISMMFDKSIPLGDRDAVLKETHLITKEEIIAQYPKSDKVLCTSRFGGVYYHYGEYIPVFKLGASMYWVDNAESQVRDFLAGQIFHKPITKAIFFIDSYENEANRLLYQPEEDKRNFGKALRETLELSSCYKKVFLFNTDREGIAHLRLFRSFKENEELFLDSVFEERQRVNDPADVVDGYIDDLKCSVLFSGDIIKIKRIRRMLENGMLDKLNIIGFNFQESFHRTAFAPWPDRVIYNSYSIAEVKEVYRP